MQINKLHILIVACIIENTCFAQQDNSNQRDCSLTMRVIGSDLSNFPYTLESVTNQSGEEFRSRFANLNATLPCDQYRLVLTKTGGNGWCGNIKKSISLSDPETWLSLPSDPTLLFLPDGSCGAIERRLPVGFALRGRILPALEAVENDRAETWIRLQSPFNPAYFVEAKADRNGDFRIYQVLVDTYLLYVERGGELWHLETIHIKNQITSEPLLINLGDKPLSKRIVK